MNMNEHTLVRSTLKTKLHEIIFEADTPASKAFDIGLMCTIVLSVLVVMLESVTGIRQHYGPALWTLEWGFTIAFTLEYRLRLSCVGQPLRYAHSFTAWSMCWRFCSPMSASCSQAPTLCW
jgi:voltage-gated potassium channel